MGRPVGGLGFCRRAPYRDHDTDTVPCWMDRGFGAPCGDGPGQRTRCACARPCLDRGGDRRGQHGPALGQSHPRSRPSWTCGGHRWWCSARPIGGRPCPGPCRGACPPRFVPSRCRARGACPGWNRCPGLACRRPGGGRTGGSSVRADGARRAAPRAPTSGRTRRTVCPRRGQAYGGRRGCMARVRGHRQDDPDAGSGTRHRTRRRSPLRFPSAGVAHLAP